MKPNVLSNSQVNTYEECPQKYDYKYRKKIRSKTSSAALLFGTAFDKASEAMYQGRSNYDEIFHKIWEVQPLGENPNTYIPTSIDIVYSNSDYDEDLLTEEDKFKFFDKYNEYVHVSIPKVTKKKDTVGFKGLTNQEKEMLNYANWLCLNRKGPIMLKALYNEFFKNVKEVLATQEKIELKNDTDDKIIGYLDVVVRYGDYPKPIIMDTKTSAIDYDDDDVILDRQLTTYIHEKSEKYENTRLAGFIVVKKRIKKNKTKICKSCGNDGTGKRHDTCDAIIKGKRCKGEWDIQIEPEAEVQILIDEIPEQTENIVLENYDKINQSIKEGKIHRNFNSCKTHYGKCEYFDLCYKNSMENLYQKK